MTAPALTPAQVAVLRELAKEGAGAYYGFADNPLRRAWQVHCGGWGRFRSKQVWKLIERGFVARVDKSSMAFISDAGRAYLAHLDAEPKP
jgi:hypothetical protein